MDPEPPTEGEDALATMNVFRALGVRIARKHIGWCFDAWPRSGAPALRKTVLTSEDPAMVMRLIAAWFDDAAETRVAA